MASDDRWTVERLERVRATVEDDGEMTNIHNGSLLALIDLALDALKAQPRWVRAGSHDESNERWIGTQMRGKTVWHLVLPLPLPPLPEEDA